MHTIGQLTVRESEVLRLLASGHTYDRVAELLGVSRNTVASHVKNIYRKLGVHSARAALWRALQVNALDNFKGRDPGAEWVSDLRAHAPASKDPDAL